jgi:hypothetical protein
MSDDYFLRNRSTIAIIAGGLKASVLQLPQGSHERERLA